jgi:hypothetical protein
VMNDLDPGREKDLPGNRSTKRVFSQPQTGRQDMRGREGMCARGTNGVGYWSDIIVPAMITRRPLTPHRELAVSIVTTQKGSLEGLRKGPLLNIRAADHEGTNLRWNLESTWNGDFRAQARKGPVQTQPESFPTCSWVFRMDSVTIPK